VKNAPLRMIGVLVAILLLGMAGFAVAGVVQASRVSQIPTVVTARASASPGPATAQSLVSPTKDQTHTATATSGQSAPTRGDSGASNPASGQRTDTQDSPTSQAAESSNARREVVKPSVREDGEDHDDAE
jgi:hypothetical protein